MKAKQLVAHRGYPQRITENTLESIQAAIDAGAMYVEVDVQLSKDGEPLLFHDRDLTRLAGNPQAIHELEYNDIKTLSVLDKHRFTSETPRLRIPHLKNLVEVIHAHPEVTVFIEIKRVSLEFFGVERVLTTILPYLKKIQSHCVVISYSLEALKSVHQGDNYPIGIVIDEWHEREELWAEELAPEYLFCSLDSLPESGIISYSNSQVVAFECVDPELAKRLLAQGVDLIETFAIGEMLKIPV